MNDMVTSRLKTADGDMPVSSGWTDLDPWNMANLSSKRTGLPFIVWISSGQGSRHSARVKIAVRKADLPENMTTVALQPQPTYIDGPRIRSADFDKLSAWITLNLPALLDLWMNEITTDEFLDRHQALTGDDLI